MLGKVSAWSEVRIFRTAILPPTLSAPPNGLGTANQKPTFDWNDPAGATGYIIQISKNVGFTSLVGKYTVKNSTYTPSKNLPHGTLWWRVEATGPNGPSAWSKVWSVIIP